MRLKFWKKKPSKLVKSISQYNGDDLTPWELKIVRTAQCPDCESGQGLLEGPRGPGAQNIMCANEECGSKFNYMWEIGSMRISDRQPKKQVTNE